MVAGVIDDSRLFKEASARIGSELSTRLGAGAVDHGEFDTLATDDHLGRHVAGLDVLPSELAMATPSGKRRIATLDYASLRLASSCRDKLLTD